MDTFGWIRQDARYVSDDVPKRVIANGVRFALCDGNDANGALARTCATGRDVFPVRWRVGAAGCVRQVALVAFTTGRNRKSESPVRGPFTKRCLRRHTVVCGHRDDVP